MDGGSQLGHQILEEAKMSSSIPASHLDHLPSPFFANQSYLDFQQQLEYEIATSLSPLQVPEPNNAKMPHSCENFENNPELIFPTEQEKSSSARDLERASLISSSGSSRPVFSSDKKRIRWSDDLHRKFVECVNSIGGADKATPKAILKMMKSKGLTIFHVKSHLQKYRSEKIICECKQSIIIIITFTGKTDERTISDMPQLYMKKTLKIKEALQLQLDVEKHIHQQLEIQRQLQLQIEENGRQLKLMLQQQQKLNK
ncbi:myb family transcription factor PHL5-like [Jatropha curcas]|uniref:myb family transcription factor PHL5-like n=1 Tax=Jatropha curcas TaxID=180498 RepID=UPI0009D74BA4|nr:myb family transcription factor PHL5-like [Jatropha curcas]